MGVATATVPKNVSTLARLLLCSAKCAAFVFVVVLILSLITALTIYYYIGIPHLVNQALDRTVNTMRHKLDPIEIPYTLHEFKYTLLFKFKLGSIEWLNTHITGLKNMQRIHNVDLVLTNATLVANITLGCTDLKAESTMKPRIGSFSSSVPIPVRVNIGYAQVNFQMKQAISLTSSPVVEGLVVQKFEQIDVHFKVAKLVDKLARILMKAILKYYNVNIRQMLAANLEAKINSRLGGYTLPYMLNPMGWIFG